MLDPLARTENIIAFTRVLLAVGALMVIWVAPNQPAHHQGVAYVLLTAYFVYSLALFLVVRGKRLSHVRLAPLSLAADIGWFSAIVVFTEGGTSPFFLFYVYALLTASVRWGMRATVRVTIVAAILYPALAFFAQRSSEGDEFIVRWAHLFRPAYLLVLGYLIGYLGEHERRAKRKLMELLELPTTWRPGRPLGHAFARLLKRGLDTFRADIAVLVLQDPDSGGYFCWRLQLRNRRSALSVSISETDPLPFASIPATEGFFSNDLRSAFTYDVQRASTGRRMLGPAELAPLGPHVRAVLGAPVLLHGSRRGSAFLVHADGRKFSREDLEFLLLLVSQSAPVLENARLQTKAEAMAVNEERARIARDLHDGFIQALAAIDLRVQACRVLLDREPVRVGTELRELHGAVERGYREARSYLAALRSARPPTTSLRPEVERIAADFRARGRVRVEFSALDEPVGVPPAATHEITQIIREALTNAERHGAATEVRVQLAAAPDRLTLTIRDNGAGFPVTPPAPDGLLPDTATPWSIRERVATLGGTLHIWTRPGEGAELRVTVPAGHAAGGGVP